MHKWTIKIESVQWIKLNDNKLKWAEICLKQQADYLSYLSLMLLFSSLSSTSSDEIQNHFFFFFLNTGMSFQSWMPYRLYKGKCTKGRRILTRWASGAGAGPAASFKAAGLEELASEHGQEFTKTKLPAPNPSYSHYICLLFPPTLLCFTAPWTKVTSTTHLRFVHSACLD